MGFNVHPTSEVIWGFEMRIIGGNRGEAVSFIQQLVMEIPAIAQIILNFAAVVINFHGMGGIQGVAIFNRIARPCRVGDGDEGARVFGAAGEFWPGFFWAGRLEIQRQACGQNMPLLACAGFWRVEFRAPIKVVKSLPRKLRVSLTGKLKCETKCSDSCRKS